MNEDTKQMKAILERLQSATTNATKQVITEVQDGNVEVATGLKTGDTIRVADVKVELYKEKIVGLYEKTFYRIKNEDNEVLYEDISLFETAMTIVKDLVGESKSKINVERILDYDKRYADYMYEAATHKSRMKQYGEDNHKYDIADAKFGQSLSRMNECKTHIKNLL
tara:strand:- start:10179 stop:10679 length:501 start_codon:yes stop_codon:yes gene_type:complete